MRRSGSPSWRFSEGIDQLPVVALYVRDALGLAVPAGRSVPPALDPTVPDRSELLDGDRRSGAGVQWLGWWDAALAHAARGHRGPPYGTDLRTWVRRMAAEGGALFDPPEFSSLTGRPALRDAFRAGQHDALEWTERRRTDSAHAPHGASGAFGHRLVRAAAEESIRRHRVSPDAVSGYAIVLPVAGIWWRRYEPGGVLCSIHAAEDDRTAQEVLRAVFKSSLAT